MKAMKAMAAASFAFGAAPRLIFRSNSGHMRLPPMWNLLMIRPAANSMARARAIMMMLITIIAPVGSTLA